MNREDYIASLDRLVAQHTRTSGRFGISREEADTLLAEFDEREAEELALFGAEAFVTLSAALLWVYLAASLKDAGSVPTNANMQQVARAYGAWGRSRTEAEHGRLLERMRSRLTVPGSRTVSLWHRDMRNAIARYTAAEAMLGKGSPLTDAERVVLQTRLNEQLARLKRFADEVSARTLLQRPMSNRQIAARLQMYTAAAQEAYYTHRMASAPAGTVVYFEGYDTGNSCSPCISARAGSPYLPGRAPIPSAICDGGGHCHDALREEFNPELYRSLQ